MRPRSTAHRSCRRVAHCERSPQSTAFLCLGPEVQEPGGAPTAEKAANVTAARAGLSGGADHGNAANLCASAIARGTNRRDARRASRVHSGRAGPSGSAARWLAAAELESACFQDVRAAERGHVNLKVAPDPTRASSRVSRRAPAPSVCSGTRAGRPPGTVPRGRPAPETRNPPR